MGNAKRRYQGAAGHGKCSRRQGPAPRRTLDRQSLREWIPKIAAMTTEERATLPGVSAGRARQVLAGALVAEAAMDIFDVDELIVCPWALREGVILRKLDGLVE